MHRLSAVSSVRCLGCGTVYAKPDDAGTAHSNPGCPTCSYVGWVREDDEITEELELLRSALGPLPHRFWRSG
jgi:predicted  nucleic acid-binding Zn-ribbon protein